MAAACLSSYTRPKQAVPLSQGLCVSLSGVPSALPPLYARNIPPTPAPSPSSVSPTSSLSPQTISVHLSLGPDPWPWPFSPGQGASHPGAPGCCPRELLNYRSGCPAWVTLFLNSIGLRARPSGTPPSEPLTGRSACEPGPNGAGTPGMKEPHFNLFLNNFLFKLPLPCGHGNLSI